MEKPDIDLTLHILFNYLEEKGLIVKEATVKSVRKQYFKRKDFEKFLDEKDNKKEFIEKINGLFQINNEASCDDIINLFINARYLLISYPTVYEAKLKYPKSLVLSNEISEEEKNERKTFFILNFKREEKKSHFWLIVISLIILLFCLLPIWPLPVKLAIWWISYIFLVLIFGLITIRSTIFLFFYIFGYDLWIFPNLFDDKLGVKESFFPFFSCDKREETITTIFIRLSISVLAIYIGWNIYNYPELLENAKDHAYEVYNDIFEWGNEKIINYHNGTSISIVDKNNYYRNLVNDEEDLIE